MIANGDCSGGTPGDRLGTAMQRYQSDQRAYFDVLVTDGWNTYNWKHRALREAFDIEQIFRITGPVATVLQVGCGVGSQDPIIASYDFVARVDAIDPSERSIERAEQNFPHPKVQRWVAGYEDLPERGAYDLTLSVDVFEHLDHPDAYLRKMRSVVKPGGYIAVVTPNPLRWQNLALRAQGKPPVLLAVSHFPQ